MSGSSRVAYLKHVRDIIRQCQISIEVAVLVFCTIILFAHFGTPASYDWRLNTISDELSFHTLKGVHSQYSVNKVVVDLKRRENG